MRHQVITPRLAKEIELRRPAKGLAERLFRFSLFCALGTPGVLAILGPLISKKNAGGIVYICAAVVSGFFVVCFLYAISYIAARFVKNPNVKAAWFTTLAFIAAIIFGTTFF